MLFHELIIDFIISSHSQFPNQVISPFSNSPGWNMFIYAASKRKMEMPELNCLEGFDWDGPYPKSRQLREYLPLLPLKFNTWIDGTLVPLPNLAHSRQTLNPHTMTQLLSLARNFGIIHKD